jgi:hypothetical protein
MFSFFIKTSTAVTISPDPVLMKVKEGAPYGKRDLDSGSHSHFCDIWGTKW